MGTFETTTTTMASAMTSTSAFTPTTAGLKARRANKTFSRSTVRVQARKPLFGYEAPDFSAEAVFDPLDFTFVCPTEITAFSDRYEEFAKLNTEVLGCSVDSKFSHLAWLQTDRNDGGLGDLAYPLVSDLKREITEAYDVLYEDGTALLVCTSSIAKASFSTAPSTTLRLAAPSTKRCACFKPSSTCKTTRMKSARRAGPRVRRR